ncbi:SRPBCC domain-containing protein [Streptomyces decoyicus]|uniref:SRPBCC domain-containing protein n=1 Tax=Streptomyces decoyicus TaxID=249567 RepID=UPI0033B01660
MTSAVDNPGDPEDLTTVRGDQFLAHPPAKVWRALTEPDLIAQWLMPADFRLEVGHRYTMTTLPRPRTGFSGTVANTHPSPLPRRRTGHRRRERGCGIGSRIWPVVPWPVVLRHAPHGRTTITVG